MDLRSIADGSDFEHSRQVAEISGLLARKLGYSRSEISIITQAAGYHDLGKLAIPKEILNKPGPLTPAEFELVKTHTDIGCAQLSEAAEILSLASTLAHYHHEKIDGHGGYHGLAGSEIPPIVRLVAVGDVADALLSRRAYKSPWNAGAVLDYFKEQAGKQFDGEVVAVLISIIDDVLLLYGKERKQP